MKKQILLFNTILSSLLFLCHAALATPATSPTLLQNPALIQAAQAMENQGSITQEQNHKVYLKLFDDYVTKLYPILLTRLNEKNKKCLVPNSQENANQIFLYQASESQMFAQQMHSFTITGVYQRKKLSKKNNQPIDETAYLLKIDSPELKRLAAANQHAAPLYLLLGYSKQFIKTGGCATKFPLLK